MVVVTFVFGSIQEVIIVIIFFFVFQVMCNLASILVQKVEGEKTNNLFRIKDIIKCILYWFIIYLLDMIVQQKSIF